MKKLAVITCLFFVFACSKEKKDQADQNSENTKVEENSKRNVTPQLDYDTTNSPAVDTISSAKGAEKQAK